MHLIINTATYLLMALGRGGHTASLPKTLPPFPAVSFYYYDSCLCDFLALEGNVTSATGKQVYLSFHAIPQTGKGGGVRELCSAGTLHLGKQKKTRNPLNAQIYKGDIPTGRGFGRAQGFAKVKQTGMRPQHTLHAWGGGGCRLCAFPFFSFLAFWQAPAQGCLLSCSQPPGGTS